jgi:hypothetical protein
MTFFTVRRILMPSLRALLVFALSLTFSLSSSGFGQNTAFTSEIPPLAQLTDGKYDQFGAFVAMSADAKTIVVGNPEQTTGEAYVFVEPPGGWTTTSTYTAKLTIPGSDVTEFGWGVAICEDGNTIVVGAPWTNGFEGEAFVFVKPTTGWQTTSHPAAMLSASDKSGGSFFGASVAIRANTIVANGNQKAYVFVKPSNGWTTTTETAQLTSSDEHKGFGSAVAIEGSTIVVGANPGVSSDPGKVYVFLKPAGGWTSETETAQLSPSNGSFGEQFGVSVALDRNTIVVGADEEFEGAGAAYVFVKPIGGWANMTETAELTASDTIKYALFGSAVAINRNVILVGASEGDSGKRGAAYGYAKPQSGWTTTSNFNAKLTPPPQFQGQLYGGTVALAQPFVVIGAIGGDPKVAGVTYVYQH